MLLTQSAIPDFIHWNSIDVKQVYVGYDLIWSQSPINKDFLKYYEGNFKRFFVLEQGDPLAPFDVTKIFALSSEFVNPSYTPDWKKDYDEFLLYNSSNLNTKFINEVIKGVNDQVYSYTFLDTNPVHEFDSVIDQYLSYTFNGPDTGINPWVKNYDEFLLYNSSNLNTKFITEVIKGVPDQLFNCTFLDTTPLLAGDPDQFYKPELNTQFLGPDTGINPWVKNYDEFLLYNSSNLNTKFIEFIAKGVIDQPLTTSFLDINNISGLQNEIDQYLSYTFNGPDSGINPWIVDYSYFMLFNSSNIVSFFGTGDGDPGVFDQFYIIKSNNISTYFLA